MKKMRNDNKGFTLVEMIVVLVILAILAAILVPALLGYIDEAKQKQYVLHAKSAYTAAQSVMSKIYAKDSGKPADIASDPYKTNVANIAELDNLKCTGLQVGCMATYTTPSGTTTKSSQKKAFTIDWVKYTEAGVTIYLKDGEWSETVSTPTGGPYTIR